MLVRADVGAEVAVVVVVASAPSVGAGAPMMRLRRLANRPRAGDSSRLGVLVESATEDELDAARSRPLRGVAGAVESVVEEEVGAASAGGGGAGLAAVFLAALFSLR